VLGDLDDLTVLDAFAGSGALGFEAVSRGAKHVILIDNERVAQKTIADNIQSLHISNSVKLIKASANAWLSTNEDATFNIVVCDPPYDNLQLSLLSRLAEHVANQGIMVVSLPPKAAFELSPDKFVLEVSKDYGDARLVFYRRIR
jgi:16S rRNA (guanine966-N2)-methyltransferase